MTLPIPRRRLRRARWQVPALGSALLAASLIAPGPVALVVADVPAPATLHEFAGCTALVEHLRAAALPRVTPWGLQEGVTRRSAGGGWTPSAQDGAGEADPAARRALEMPPGFAAPTAADPQERGAEEPDTAKTDGRVLVSLGEGQLRVFDVDGAEPVARGSLDLGGLAPAELLLSGDRVLVLGTWAAGVVPGQRWHTLALGVVDIADRDHPRMLARQALTGSHVTTRMVGGVARVVLSTSPYLVFGAPGAGRTEMQSLERNREALRRAGPADWLPSRRVIDATGRTGPAQRLLPCTAVRRPAGESGLDVLSILTLDLSARKAFDEATATAVVASGEQVYASATRLYIATADAHWRWGRPVDSVYAWARARTAVHAFDLTDRRRTDYTGSAWVPGWAPDRSAMSERAGFLRVVTSYDPPGPGARASAVSVLRAAAGQVEVVGRVAGLAPGEEIHAVRWFDDLAALATYGAAGPLHLVDLTTPAKPVAAGTLRAGSYAQFLHQVGGGRVLGAGQAGDGWDRDGLRVSAFDVADPAAPRRAGGLRYGTIHSSTSLAADPRGFLFVPETGTAVLPADLPAEWRCTAVPTCERSPDFTGLVGVRVAPDGAVSRAGSWRTLGTGPVKAVRMADGRIAALDSLGLTVLDAADLTVRSFVPYAPPTR